MHVRSCCLANINLSPVQTDATLLANNSQHCWMLHVASVCTPCCMLLDVVACCCAKFETGQTFSPVQTDATLLAYNSQHCWELLHPFARSLNRQNNCFASTPGWWGSKIACIGGVTQRMLHHLSGVSTPL